MHPQLKEIVDEYEAAHDRLHTLITGLDADRWSARPAPGEWSAAECVAHLNISAEKYMAGLEEAMARARSMPPHSGRFKLGLLGSVFRRLVGPLPRILGSRRGGVSAPPSFSPEGDHPMEATVAEFDRLYGRLIEITRECDGVQADAVKFPSPFDARVKVTPFLSVAVLARHAHRHLQQAEDAVRA